MAVKKDDLRVAKMVVSMVAWTVEQSADSRETL